MKTNTQADIPGKHSESETPQKIQDFHHCWYSIVFQLKLLLHLTEPFKNTLEFRSEETAYPRSRTPTCEQTASLHCKPIAFSDAPPHL